jgi:hypothetical protein
MYHWDYAGLKLTKTQAGKMKEIQSRHKWPDLFIAEPRDIWHGCFIEVKPEGTRLAKLNDDPASPHIREQAQCINALIDRKYAALFAVGFDQAKEIIDNYLKS